MTPKRVQQIKKKNGHSIPSNPDNLPAQINNVFFKSVFFYLKNMFPVITTQGNLQKCTYSIEKVVFRMF